ncbi:MAG: hypothetical protein JSW28_07615 [Thermoplasmata archaeon]|nr:MAG: hypothetical protein JSW28_07615 [Thermoplasmata archaeon]
MNQVKKRSRGRLLCSSTHIFWRIFWAVAFVFMVAVIMYLLGLSTLAILYSVVVRGGGPSLFSVFAYCVWILITFLLLALIYLDLSYAPVRVYKHGFIHFLRDRNFRDIFIAFNEIAHVRFEEDGSITIGCRKEKYRTHPSNFGKCYEVFLEQLKLNVPPSYIEKQAAINKEGGNTQ